MNRTSLFSCAMVLSLVSGGCASDATTGDEQDVRTKRCPTHLVVQIGAYEARTIPATTKAAGGTHTITADEREQLEVLQGELIEAGTHLVEGTLEERKSGVCRYSDATGRLAHKLYTKNGKNILEMDVDPEHRIVAFPTLYSPEGFGFDDDSAILDGVLLVGDGGPNVIVRVGDGSVLVSDCEALGAWFDGACGSEVDARSCLASHPLADLGAMGEVCCADDASRSFCTF